MKIFFLLEISKIKKQAEAVVPITGLLILRLFISENDFLLKMVPVEILFPVHSTVIFSRHIMNSDIIYVNIFGRYRDRKACKIWCRNLPRILRYSRIEGGLGTVSALPSTGR